MGIKSSYPISLVYLLGLVVLPVVIGTVIGRNLCPTIGLLMGNMPVPYAWIELQPVEQRYFIFLLGAFGLFCITSSLTAGVSAVLLGFLFRRHYMLTALMLFICTALSYSACIVDSVFLESMQNFSGWIDKPINRLYLLEFAFLLMLCLLSSWVGSVLGKGYVLIRDSYNERYCVAFYSR